MAKDQETQNQALAWTLLFQEVNERWDGQTLALS